MNRAHIVLLSSAHADSGARLLHFFDPASEKAPASPLPSPSAADLLQTFKAFAEFLLEEEATAICGAGRCSQTDQRRNYRAGSHARGIQTPHGRVFVRVPNLRWIHVRPSMAKRFARHADRIADTISYCLNYGAETGNMASLIQTLWTLELPELLHYKLASKAAALLEKTRARLRMRDVLETCAAKTTMPAPEHGYAVY